MCVLSRINQFYYYLMYAFPYCNSFFCKQHKSFFLYDVYETESVWVVVVVAVAVSEWELREKKATLCVSL